MSKTVDIMGHIAMWKGKRVDSDKLYEALKSYHSVLLPDVPYEKNFIYSVKRALSAHGKFAINKMWRAWDRQDSNRNLYEIVPKGEEYLETVYKEPFYVRLYDDLITFGLYENKQAVIDKNVFILQDQDPRLLSWYERSIQKEWDKHINTYDSTIVNNVIQDLIDKYLFAKELSSRVVWMDEPSAAIWHTASDKLSDIGIELLDFPPSHSPESIASLFKVVKAEFEQMTVEIQGLEAIMSQPAGDTARNARRYSETIENYRKNVETLRPVFAGMAEFDELAERNSKKTRRMSYENTVAVNSDLFDDVTL